MSDWQKLEGGPQQAAEIYRQRLADFANEAAGRVERELKAEGWPDAACAAAGVKTREIFGDKWIEGKLREFWASVQYPNPMVQ